MRFANWSKVYMRNAVMQLSSDVGWQRNQKSKWRYDTSLSLWLKSLHSCRFATTITFGTGRGSNPNNPTKRTVEEILRKGIKRLNTLCYRNLVKRKGFSIGAIAVIEGTRPNERIHAHISFEPPPDMSLIKFRRLVALAFKPSKWIEQRPQMKICWNEEWVNYILKLGQEALVPSCCFEAKHPSA